MLNMLQRLENHNKRSATLPSGSSRGMSSRTIVGIRERAKRRNTEGAMLEREVYMDDQVIAVMGPTGVGKSNARYFLQQFIMKLIGTASDQPGLQLSSTSLRSHTSDIQLIRILNNPTYGDRIVIVDTPGFDDTYKSDMEILTIIGKWLEKTYRGQVRLAGIFYLHRISDNRMAGSPRKNLAMFKRLTGDPAAKRVVFVTTMWDLAKDEARREAFRKRTDQLLNLYWQDTLRAGAQVAPFDNTHEAAMKCIDLILPTYSRNPNIPATVTPLNIQEELVVGGKRINETDAGQELYSSLQATLNQTKKTLQELQDQAKDVDDHETAKRLKKDIAMTELQLERTSKDVSGLKVPWWRRLYLNIPSNIRIWVFNILYRPETTVELEVDATPDSPLPPGGVFAPPMAPQISESNYVPQPRFREFFLGSVISIPDTPVLEIPVVNGPSGLVEEPKNDAPTLISPIQDHSDFHTPPTSPLTSESPENIGIQLPPDPV